MNSNRGQRPLSMPRSRGQNEGGRCLSTCLLSLSALLLSVIFFSVGFTAGIHSSMGQQNNYLSSLAADLRRECNCPTGSKVGTRLGALTSSQGALHQPMEVLIDGGEKVSESAASKSTPKIKTETDLEASVPNEEEKGDALNTEERFPAEMHHFAVGMARTKKADFLEFFDTGHPPEHHQRPGSEDVLLLYGPSAIPKDKNGEMIKSSTRQGEIPTIDDPIQATAQCDRMNVIVTSTECTAILTGYESFTMQRWMRLKNNPKTGCTLWDEARK